MLYYILLFVVFATKLFNKWASIEYQIIILKSKTIKLGTLNVDEITLFEWKPLFCLKTFYFHVGEAQEIYHTHSFSAISFLLYGNYIESFYNSSNNSVWTERRDRSRFIFIPKNRFHQITKSEGCRTIMLTGPWGNTYTEYKPDTNEFIISTHGRKEISRERP